MDTPTSFSQIASSQILRKIISYLPKNDQLNVRLVNKCWNSEARYAIDEYGLTKIWLIEKCDMDRFLRDFPSACVQLDLKIAAASMSYQQLETFGTIHGTSVVIGEVWLPPMIQNWMEHKARLSIKYWTNIQKLSVRYYSFFISSPEFPEAQQTICSTFPKFEFLRELCVSGVTTELELMRDVLINTPAMLKVELEIMSTNPPIPAALRPLLDTLCQVSADAIVNLDVGLDFLPPENRAQATPAQSTKTFLEEMKDSGLVPDELRISLIVEVGPCHLFEGEVPKLDLPGCIDAQLQPWLKQVCEGGLEKLAIRSAIPSLVRMNMLQKMPELTVLDLGFHLDTLFLGGFFGLFGLIEPMEPIKSCQVPNLDTIISSGVHNPMSKTCVFHQVTRLRLYHGAQIYKLPLTLFEDFSGSWVTQFPNLTAVDIPVLPESYGSIKSLFTNFVNLTELRLLFNENPYDEDEDTTEGSWDVMTGGLRPIMDADTSLAVLKGESTSGGSICGGSGSASTPAGQPSIKNLKNLKMLDLFGPPDCIVMAIIHFTATKAIPRLNKLKMSLVNEEMLSVVSNCWDVLSPYHGRVDVTDSFPVPMLPKW